uniref:Epidermal growth factor receptor pathway substrate 15 n=1 Tax=Homo sapiens TaxID=9606 RepID=A0A994J7R8_HUMAN
MAAAAQLSLTQLSSGNPVYEKYYRQFIQSCVILVQLNLGLEVCFYEVHLLSD